MRSMFIVAAALGALVAQAGADEYWIAYEGNDLPENEGWTRNTYAGGAERWLEDGALVIDSISVGDPQATDAYRQVDVRRPERGELFVAEWRMRLDQFEGFYDASVVISRPEPRGWVQFGHGLDHLVVFDEWDEIPVAPHECHTYRFESHDMDAYTLFVDGAPAYEGYFQTPSLLDPLFAFGNMARGAASVSRWDYVRFGIVPEPGSLVLVMFLWAVGAAWLAEARTDRNGREG
jgi:hypothetical protein